MLNYDQRHTQQVYKKKKKNSISNIKNFVRKNINIAILKWTKSNSSSINKHE